MTKTKAAGIFVLGGLLLSTALAALNPGGGADEPVSPAEKPPELETVRIDGRVRLVGSGVQPEVVISTGSGEWYIARDEQNQFLKFQQMRVQVEGKADSWKLILADGTYLETRNILRDILFVEPVKTP
jgi:hypothetical protein